MLIIKRSFFTILIIFLILSKMEAKKKVIKLPKPNYNGKVSVEKAIYNRQSIRSYSKQSLTLKEVSQLLWSANGINVDGITGASRSFPSAGGLYPLDVYFISFNIHKLDKACYKYIPEKNELRSHIRGNLRDQISKAAYSQSMFQTAAGVIVYVYDFNKIRKTYGERGARLYGPMDVGHSAENVYLQAESLGIGTVAVGAFDHKAVEKILNIKDKEVVYMLPVGKK